MPHLSLVVELPPPGPVVTVTSDRNRVTADYIPRITADGNLRTTGTQTSAVTSVGMNVESTPTELTADLLPEGVEVSITDEDLRVIDNGEVRITTEDEYRSVSAGSTSSVTGVLIIIEDTP